jgi:tetratricopeptide (TPR) repeat protein
MRHFIPHARTANSIRLVACLSLTAAVALPLASCANKSDTFELPDSARPEAQAESIRKAHALAARAEQAGKERKYTEAVALYEEAIGYYRNFPSAWLNLGVMYTRAGDNIKAVAAFSTAADLDQTDPRPLFNTGAIWENMYYYKEAIGFYNKALERDPNLLPALRHSIYLEMQTNSFTPATKERLQRALMLETDPQFKSIFAQAKLRLDNELTNEAITGN